MATQTATDWTEQVLGRAQFSQAFIDGEFVDTASGETFPSVTPITGQSLGVVAACGPEDVDRAVAAARRAFEDGRWSELAPRDRKNVLLRLAELMLEHRSELASLMTIDMGRPIAAADWEAGYSSLNVQWFAEAIDHVYGEVAPLGPKALGTITREPLGVIGAIVPWNFPLLMPVWKLAPALATGNSVVLKPSEQSSLVALRLAEIISEAGVPDGVFNVVPGLGEVTGQALASHMDVDGVTFTGSTPVGRLIMRYAAESNLKKVSLELGGKSPNVIFGDVADLDVAASMSAGGIFVNSGQMCDAGSRLIVHESVADELIERIAKASAEWQPGDPFDEKTTMGSMVDEAQMRRVLEYIELGQSEGAELAFGGERVLEETGGFYIEPTVFTKTSNDMRVAQEEIFGPVLSTITFSTEEEAIALANQTNYGLAGAVWTQDITRAHRLARKLRAGTVWVNCYDLGDVSLPHGGFKQSGFGRDKSLHALDNYTDLKTTYINLA